MKFEISEGNITLGSSVTTVEKFCKYHEVDYPSTENTHEDNIRWFMGVVESKKIPASFAVMDASDGAKKTKKFRAKELEFFKEKGMLRYAGNQDKSRHCNYCSSLFISIGGSRKCHECIEKTNHYYY